MIRDDTPSNAVLADIQPYEYNNFFRAVTDPEIPVPTRLPHPPLALDGSGYQQLKPKTATVSSSGLLPYTVAVSPNHYSVGINGRWFPPDDARHFGDVTPLTNPLCGFAVSLILRWKSAILGKLPPKDPTRLLRQRLCQDLHHKMFLTYQPPPQEASFDPMIRLSSLIGFSRHPAFHEVPKFNSASVVLTCGDRSATFSHPKTPGAGLPVKSPLCLQLLNLGHYYGERRDPSSDQLERLLQWLCHRCDTMDQDDAFYERKYRLPDYDSGIRSDGSDVHFLSFLRYLWHEVPKLIELYIPEFADYCLCKDTL